MSYLTDPYLSELYNILNKKSNQATLSNEMNKRLHQLVQYQQEVMKELQEFQQEAMKAKIAEINNFKRSIGNNIYESLQDEVFDNANKLAKDKLLEVTDDEEFKLKVRQLVFSMIDDYINKA